MCFDTDARPPLPPIRGGALDAGRITLTSRDGTKVLAHSALADAPSGAGIVIIPDVRGLHPYYEELALRFAEAGVHVATVTIRGLVGEDRSIHPDTVAALYADLVAETAGPRENWRTEVELRA